MPKKIDPALRERAVRLVLEHRAEYPSTAKDGIPAGDLLNRDFTAPSPDHT